MSEIRTKVEFIESTENFLPMCMPESSIELRMFQGVSGETILSIQDENGDIATFRLTDENVKFMAGSMNSLLKSL